MKFRARNREEPEINLIPFIDVLLVTIIFLLVTTSFSREARLHLKLPEAASDAKIESANLRIAIDARGQYFINDKQLLNATTETVSESTEGRKHPQPGGRVESEVVSAGISLTLGVLGPNEEGISADLDDVGTKL